MVLNLEKKTGIGNNVSSVGVMLTDYRLARGLKESLYRKKPKAIRCR